MRKLACLGLVLILTFVSSKTESMSFTVGQGAGFSNEKVIRDIQGDIFKIRGYINSVIEKIRIYYETTNPGVFPGSEEIPSPEIGSFPISKVIYGSGTYQEANTPESVPGVFIIRMERVGTGSEISDKTNGATFRFEPKGDGNQLVQVQCYTDLEDIGGTLYLGYTEPAVGSAPESTKNLGEVFSNCIHIPNDSEDAPFIFDDILGYDADPAWNLDPPGQTSGWMSVYTA